MLNIHYTEGDGKGWAIDEDLRQVRAALSGTVRETGAADADVIHNCFWQNLAMVAPPLRQQAFVIAHADNPPFFYLKQPEFADGQTQVDLWVARSSEALEQFQRLHLPVVHIPYAIDPALFFPIPDKRALRREFGIPETDYVIANFHRDSEGGDLQTPKLQKAPEFLVAVLKRLRDAGVAFHVLLAGPRRHWIRKTLRNEGIPFTFVGATEIEGDDFGVNILGRECLNKLYNAADLNFIPSRWEGGPQSAMEAAACRCKILSIPLGVARDILEPESLVRTPSEAAERLIEDIRGNSLGKTLAPQFEKWKTSHTISTMGDGLRRLYQTLPELESFQRKSRLKRMKSWRGWSCQIRHSVRRRLCQPVLPQEVGWNHRPGEMPELDEILTRVREALDQLKIRVTVAGGIGPEIIGWPQRAASPGRRSLQWIVPGLPREQISPEALLIVPSVQDVLNLRAAGCCQAAVVRSVPMSASVEGSGNTLLVGPSDFGASLRIWRALAAGRPIVYPRRSAYFEQVFHAGFSYAEESESVQLVEAAEACAEELRSFIRIPTPMDVARSLRMLLQT